jgi:hypothetical protein
MTDCLLHSDKDLLSHILVGNDLAKYEASKKADIPVLFSIHWKAFDITGVPHRANAVNGGIRQVKTRYVMDDTTVSGLTPINGSEMLTALRCMFIYTHSSIPGEAPILEGIIDNRDSVRVYFCEEDEDQIALRSIFINMVNDFRYFFHNGAKNKADAFLQKIKKMVDGLDYEITYTDLLPGMKLQVYKGTGLDKGLMDILKSNYLIIDFKITDEDL